MIPDPWPALILALGVFRLVRLVILDDITATLRAWVTGLTDDEYKGNDEITGWAELVWKAQQRGLDPWSDGIPGDSSPDRMLRPGRVRVPIGRFRFKVAQLSHCAWCAGVWVSIASYLAWYAAGYATMTVATPLALSAVVGLVSKHMDG